MDEDVHDGYRLVSGLRGTGTDAAQPWSRDGPAVGVAPASGHVQLGILPGPRGGRLLHPWHAVLPRWSTGQATVVAYSRRQGRHRRLAERPEPPDRGSSWPARTSHCSSIGGTATSASASTRSRLGADPRRGSRQSGAPALGHRRSRAISSTWPRPADQTAALLGAGPRGRRGGSRPDAARHQPGMAHLRHLRGAGAASPSLFVPNPNSVPDRFLFPSDEGLLRRVHPPGARRHRQPW